MNHPPAHLIRPGQLPAPATGEDSLAVLTEAIDSLARQRTPYWLGDPGVRLHALTSLIVAAPGPHHDALAFVGHDQQHVRGSPAGSAGAVEGVDVRSSQRRAGRLPPTSLHCCCSRSS